MMRKTQAMMFVALLSLVLLATTGMAAEPKAAEPAKPAAAPPPPTIPVAEVAPRAEEVANVLGSLSGSLVPSAEIETITSSLRNASELIGVELAETKSLLDEQQTLELLQTQQEHWQQRRLQTVAWLAALTKRVNQLQDALDHIADLQKTWTETRAAARAAKAPQTTLQQIDATLASLVAAQRPIQTERAAALDLQSRVGAAVARCNSVLAQIAQVQQKAVTGMLVRNAPPIWSAEVWADVRGEFRASLRKVAARYQEDLLLYVRNPAFGLPWHLGLFLLLAILLRAARRQFDTSDAGDKTSSPAMAVYDHPYAAAYLVTLLFATAPISPPMPQAAKELGWIVNMLPVILLNRRVIEAQRVPRLYAMTLLYAVDMQRRAVSAAGSPLVGQAHLVVECFVGLAVMLWLLRTARRSAGAAVGQSVVRVSLLISLFIVTFTVGLVGGSLGYVRLARLLTSGILVAGVLAAALYTAARVVTALLVFLFHLWPLRLLRMVRHHRDLLERRSYRFLFWFVTLGWLYRYLNYLGLSNPVLSLGGAILAAKLERGSISISVSDILTFVFIVWVAYKLSAFIRFLLDEEVYPHTRIAPGQAYAMSSLLNYIIVAAGFVVGIGVLGGDLSKLTVLASAFGVGIGFGLQSVINNFVSGLILLFERPIQVGDAVQVGTVLGNVRRIGIRASIVSTPQGAEIIVPNARLISEEVTNWTRSDQLRRVDVKVGISYGTAQKKVIELLESVARAQPHVLQNPPPEALFMGYGDSAINFELRAWTEHAHWVQVQSGLTGAVYDAVYAAGMSFPFPQREVRVLHDPETGSIAAPDGTVKTR